VGTVVSGLKSIFCGWYSFDWRVNIHN